MFVYGRGNRFNIGGTFLEIVTLQITEKYQLQDNLEKAYILRIILYKYFGGDFFIII